MSNLLAALRAAGSRNPARAAGDPEADEPETGAVTDPENPNPEDDPEEPEAEGDPEEPEAAGEEEPDGDEGNMRAAAYKAGFAAANRRALAILTAPHAEANADLAVKLAFDPDFTGMSSKRALALLAEAGKGARASAPIDLASRMAADKGKKFYSDRLLLNEGPVS